MEFTNEQISKAIEGLPEEFQDAIASSYVSNKVMEIGQRHALHIDQMGKLKDDAMLAALNLIESSKFSEKLTADLAIPADLAQTIVKEVNEEIFKDIRKKVEERLAEEREERENELEEEKAAITTPETASVPLEEAIDRDALLKEIETPAPTAVPSFAVSAVSVPSSAPSPTIVSAPVTPAVPVNLPVGAPTLSVAEPPRAPSGFAAVKLTGATEAPPAKTVEKSESIAAIKKTDPYREPIA